MEYNMALAGNPNVGKTSLYNRITHSLEHVGNWHGVTVKKVSKSVMFDHHTINMTDLPGLYSMTVYSYEESISRDKILEENNDLIINICEVNNLARNLYLTLQLLELNVPVVLVVNMMDELAKQGKVLNYRKIEKILKIPIVPMSTKYHSDVHLLMEVAIDYVSQYSGNLVELSYLKKLPISDVEAIISANAATAGFKSRWAAIKVLENDTFIMEKLNLNSQQKLALAQMGDWQARLAQARYEFIDQITEGAISRVSEEHHEMHEHIKYNVPVETQAGNWVDEKGGARVPNELFGDNKGLHSAGGQNNSIEYNAKKYETISKKSEKKLQKHIKHHDKHIMDKKLMLEHGFSRLDKFVLNKYLALPIFFLVMAAIFVLTFGLIGKLLTDLLELGIKYLLYSPITTGLTGIQCPQWIVALVGDGIINGVGGIFVFLPQIVLLFFFLALLEDSGYISRVAFMTDGLFRKIGLSGRSAFTLLMGFGCSATAVLTARGLEDPMMRKKTVVLTPFASCSARLPVYSTIAAAFFSGGQPFIIFFLYLLGVAVALIWAAVFEKIKRLKSGKLSFIMEMPPYRFPTAERVFQLIWNNAKVFIVRVGTVVFALNVIVWVLSNFSFTHGYISQGSDVKSILELFSSFISPIFTPLGFGNWKAVTALLSGLVAKEVVISSINSLGGVSEIFFGANASLSALTFLVFTLLYVPCIATISAMYKEVGIKWTVFNFVLQMVTAYVVSLVFHSVGLLFVLNAGITVGVIIALVVAAICIAVLISRLRGGGKCPYCIGGYSSNCKSCDKKNGNNIKK